jgi:23S rRNA (uracil1939-C5)-methyltransferase
VARAEGRTWFVAGALPGEAVDVVTERERAGVVEARAVVVENPSAWRDPDPCPVAGVCGGCDLAHVRRSAAAEVLREVACGALRHAPPALAERVRAATVELSEMAWRVRARLHWDSDRRLLGFRGPRSHSAVDISPCRVVTPRLLRSLPSLAAALAAHGAADGELEWIEDLEGEAAVGGWHGRSVPPPPVAELSGFHPLAAGGGIRSGGWGERAIVIRLPIPLRVPVGVFFQGNRHLVPSLFTRVAAIVASDEPSRVVDLYAGVGLFGAAARHAGVRAITLVEASRPAADAARDNLPESVVVAGTAEAFLADPGSARGSLAVVDPPRLGLSRRAGEGLVQWGPDSIVMLSCDAARFGRDGGRLVEAGYQLVSVGLWDLFAGSHHVEVLAHFHRADR